MDEVIRHKTSTVLRSLQEEIVLTVNSIAQTIKLLNENARTMFHNVYSPVCGCTKDMLEFHTLRAITYMKTSLDLFRSYLNFTFVGRYYSFCTSSFTKWNTGHVYAGCIGLFIGGSIGILLSLSYYPHPQYIIPMRAIVANNYTGISGITLLDETLTPVITSANDVLIHVKAASVDILDIQIATGYGRVIRRIYQNSVMKRKREFPIILGRDCSGVVIEVGHNVRRFEVGDEVWLALPYWMVGTLAEYIVVKDCYISLKPKILDFEACTTLPYSGCIAWDAVCNKAKLNAVSAYNKKVLVHCGNTSVGCVITQLCHLLGAHVTASCMEHAKFLMLDLGATETLLLDKVTSDESFHNSHNRFDIVFNTVGPNAHDFCKMLCKTDAHLINTYNAYPLSDTYGYFRVVFFRMWLKFKKMFCSYNVWKDMPISSNVLEELSSLVNTGKLRPVIDKTFSIEDFEKAFRYTSMSKNQLGKSVIRFNDDTITRNVRYWDSQNYFS